MFEEIVAADKVVEELWKRRKKIAKIMSDTFELVTKGELSVFAFGPGGSGKTTLGKVLSGKLNLGELPTSYNLSLTTEAYKLSGRAYAILYVPPGQKHMRPMHWDALKQRMAASKRYIVINIVCNGFHSLSKIEFKQHKLYKSGTSPRDFMKSYLNEQRQEEIAVLSDLMPHLKSAPGRLRLYHSGN